MSKQLSEQEKLEKKVKHLKMQALKPQLGSWIYAVLSSLTKEQYTHMIRNMDTDPKLASFKQKTLAARQLYNQIFELATPNQQPIVGKPFFYDIKHTVGFNWSTTKGGQTEGVNINGDEIIPQQAILSFEINQLNQKQIDVTKTIPSEKDWKAFCGVINQSLCPTAQTEEVIKCLSGDMADVLESLETQTEYFKQLEQQKLEHEQKVKELAAQKILNANAEEEMKTYFTKQEPTNQPDELTFNEDSQACDSSIDEIDHQEVDKENFFRKRNGRKQPPVQLSSARKLDFHNVGSSGKKTQAISEAASSYVSGQVPIHRERMAAQAAVDAVKRSLRAK